nr:MAG TPA: tail protein [Caudoviricetes sp.]
MADKSIEQLNAAEKVYLSDLFVLQQSGTAKKLTGQVLKNWLLELAQGHGGITSIVLQSTSGLNKVYRITLADDTYFDMTVTDGKGITSVAKTRTSGLVDTYTMKFNAGSDFVFTVKNGEKGDKGDADRLYFKFASQKPTDASHSTGDVPDEWLGFYAGTTPPTSWKDYTWVRIKGDKGDKGDAARLTSHSTTYMVSGSGTIVPSGSWVADVPNVPQGKYLWTKTVLTFNTGNPVTSYSVSRFGIDGSGAVSSVNGKDPDPTGNVRVNAEDITTTTGTSIEAALAQKQEQITASGLLKGTGNGGVTPAKAGTDYQAPITAGAGVRVSGSKVSTAAAPRNLLDNSDFRNPVNQRGSSSYNQNGYTIDRWAIWDGQLNIGDGYISVKNAYQSLKLATNKIYTLAAKTVAGIVCFSAKPDVGGNASLGNLQISMYVQDSLARILLTNAPENPLGGVYWAALYEGEYTAETLPEYQPKGYGAELAECQRYYTKGKVIFQRDPNIPTVLITNHEYPTVMRATPSLSFGVPASFTDGQILNATLSNHFYNNTSGLLAATISADPVVNTVIADFTATADL